MVWSTTNKTTTITPTINNISVSNPTSGVYTTGSYYSIGANGGMVQASITISGNLHIDAAEPYLKTKKYKINIDKLYENVQILNEMFHIIVPNFDKFEKNTTLMDAYLQYDSAKHIEPRYNSKEYIAAYEQFKLLEALFEEEKNDNS